jgi:hypothetical protein
MLGALLILVLYYCFTIAFVAFVAIGPLLTVAKKQQK